MVTSHNSANDSSVNCVMSQRDADTASSCLFQKDKKKKSWLRNCVLKCPFTHHLCMAVVISVSIPVLLCDVTCCCGRVPTLVCSVRALPDSPDHQQRSDPLFVSSESVWLRMIALPCWLNKLSGLNRERRTSLEAESGYITSAPSNLFGNFPCSFWVSKSIFISLRKEKKIGFPGSDVFSLSFHSAKPRPAWGEMCGRINMHQFFGFCRSWCFIFTDTFTVLSISELVHRDTQPLWGISSMSLLGV